MYHLLRQNKKLSRINVKDLSIPPQRKVNDEELSTQSGHGRKLWNAYDNRINYIVSTNKIMEYITHMGKLDVRRSKAKACKLCTEVTLHLAFSRLSLLVLGMMTWCAEKTLLYISHFKFKHQTQDMSIMHYEKTLVIYYLHIQSTSVFRCAHSGRKKFKTITRTTFVDIFTCSPTYSLPKTQRGNLRWALPKLSYELSILIYFLHF